MIYTFYSNCYEVLEKVLIHNIEQDIEQLGQSGVIENIFKKITVISPSAAIDNRLSHALADSFSANPGVEFKSLFDWLDNFLDTVLRPNSPGSALVWQIWEALNDEKFLKKKYQPPESISIERLKDYINNSDSSQLLGLCIRLSELYTRYASYRIDWLCSWMDDKNPTLDLDSKVLIDHPDYYWQKKLWKFIANYDKTRGNGDIAKLKDTYERVNNPEIESSMEGKTYHLFMPFAIPPLALPFMKAFSDEKTKADLRLYILNPSLEYWFEPVLPNSSEPPVGKEITRQYLATNAASTRAMINRLYGFLNADDADTFGVQLNRDETESIKPKAKAKLTKQQIFKLQDVQVSASSEVHFCYLENQDETYLHRFQNSILLVNPERLPNKPLKNDNSLKVFKAPTFVRELEAIVDWLHYRLKEDDDLHYSDILVAVPNIDEAAPEIEGVMGSLSKELYLPWKITGSSVINTELTTNAIIGLGHLLNSSFDKGDFLEWLELPINQEKWQLDLSDLSILKVWLDTAGFQRGLTDKQLHEYLQKDLLLISEKDEKPAYAGIDDSNDGEDANKQDDDDYSLDRAIERLTLAYMTDLTDALVYSDVIPISGDESGGFDKVNDRSGQILKTLVSISEQLKKAKEQILTPKDATNWEIVVKSWLNTFFGLKETPQEIVSFRRTFTRVIRAMQKGLGNVSVPFSVLWELLERTLGTEESYSHPEGSITFAPIAAMRGLPFKVVVLAGLDGNSGFPGRSALDEFDLMGTVSRRDDRDSRNDNRAKFLDTLLAARNSLVLSYSIGTDTAKERNPSSVIESFKEYFLSNAETDEAKKIWETVEVSIPLHSFSKGNFIKSETNKPWVSPRRELFNSLNQPVNGEEEVFVDLIRMGVDKTKGVTDRVLNAEELIDFICDAEKYLSKKFELPTDKLTLEEDHFDWLLNEDDHLANSIRRKKIFSALDNSISGNDIKKRGLFNPVYGITSVRGQTVANEIDPIDESYKFSRKCIEETNAKKIKKTVTLSLKVDPTFLDRPPNNGSVTDPSSDKEIEISITDTFEVYEAQKNFDEQKIKANSTLLVIPCFSKNAKRKASLRHLIWYASSIKNDVYLIRVTNDGSNLVLSFGLLEKLIEETSQTEQSPKGEPKKGKELAQKKAAELINIFVKIFLLAERYGIPLSKNPDSSLFHRGRATDYKALDKATDSLFSLLETFLWIENKKENAYGSNLDNLLTNAEDVLNKLNELKDKL